MGAVLELRPRAPVEADTRESAWTLHLRLEPNNWRTRQAIDQALIEFPGAVGVTWLLPIVAGETGFYIEVVFTTPDICVVVDCSDTGARSALTTHSARVVVSCRWAPKRSTSMRVSTTYRKLPSGSSVTTTCRDP